MVMVVAAAPGGDWVERQGSSEPDGGRGSGMLRGRMAAVLGLSVAAEIERFTVYYPQFRANVCRNCM